MSSQSISSGDKRNVLKKGIFDYVPGTINTNQGGAVENTTIDWTDQSVQRPVPKHITFVTSTPMKLQVEDVMDNEILAVPLPQEASTSQRHMVSGQEQTTINIIANKFRKLNPPKLQKLKGGTSPSAQLFLFGWVKEVKSVIKDRDLTESKSVQLVREFTEGKARQQVDFFLDTSPVTSSEALLEHLLAAFASEQDEAVIKSEFYGREQFSKESKDDFAEALQLLSRKILMVNPNFRAECNLALINQFTSGLHDDIMWPLACDLISRKPGISFIQFRAEIANLSWSRLQKTKTKVTTSGVEDDAEDPSKKAKSEESTSVNQIKALIESNRQLASQIETLTNITTHDVHSSVAQSVGFNQSHPQYDKGGYKKQNSNEKAKENKTYLGKTQDPIPTKGKDGNLNITDTCNYCKNPGHILSNYKKLDDRIQRGLARPIHPTQKSLGK